MEKVPACRLLADGHWAFRQFSVHQAEAIQFVEFLRKRETEIQLAHAKSAGPLWKNLQLVELPKLLDEAYPWARKPGDTPGGMLISRPSAVSGANYEAVSASLRGGAEFGADARVHGAGSSGESRRKNLIR